MSTHYATLGVSRDATPDDVKKAFRAIALKCHPDKNPGDAEAEANFKRASEAYNVLSNPDARAAYDAELQLARLQAAAESRAAREPNAPRTGNFFYDWFRGGSFTGWPGDRQHRAQRVQTIHVTVPMSTLMGGGNVYISELRATVTVRPGEALPGHMLASVETPDGRRVAVVQRVDVPPPFVLGGRDIVAELEVPFPLLTLGGVVDIPTPWRVEPLRIRLPPGPGNSRVHREVGAGVPNPDGGSAGTLTLVFTGTIPAVTTPEQAAAVRALGTSFGCDLLSPPPLAEVLRALFPSP